MVLVEPDEEQEDNIQYEEHYPVPVEHDNEKEEESKSESTCPSQIETEYELDKSTLQQQLIPQNPTECFQPFIEFPTPHLLKEANQKYRALKNALPYDDKDKLLPYPTSTSKASIFEPHKYEAVDIFAIHVSI